MIAKGRKAPAKVRHGEDCHLSKLTADDVRFIRSSGLRAKELALRFDVTPTQIYEILARRAWKSVS